MTSYPIQSDAIRRAEQRALARQWGRNPFIQAAMAYPRRWAFRFDAGWLALGMFFAMAIAVSNPQYSHDRAQTRLDMLDSLSNPGTDWQRYAILGGIFSAFIIPISTTIAAHLRERCSDFRGTLVPHYRAAHLTIGAAALIFSLATILVSVLLVLPFSAIGAVAITLGMAGVGVWLACLPAVLAGVMSLLGCGALAFSPVQLHLCRILANGGPSAAIVAALGFLSLAACWTWLAFYPTAPASSAPVEGWLEGKSLFRRTRRPHPGHLPSLLRRIDLWRTASPAGIAPFLTSLAILLISYTAAGPNDPFVAGPLILIAIVFPLAAVGTAYARRLPSLSYEMTRPVSRTRYILELASAIAIDWALWWGFLTAAAVAGFVIAQHYDAQRAFVGRTDTLDLPHIVFTSAAVQILSFGFVLWTLRFQSPRALFAVVIACAFSSFLLHAFITVFTSEYPNTYPLILATLISLGLLIAADACYRWTKADLA